VAVFPEYLIEMILRGSSPEAEPLARIGRKLVQVRNVQVPGFLLDALLHLFSGRFTPPCVNHLVEEVLRINTG